MIRHLTKTYCGLLYILVQLPRMIKPRLGHTQNRLTVCGGGAGVGSNDENDAGTGCETFVDGEWQFRLTTQSAPPQYVDTVCSLYNSVNFSFSFVLSKYVSNFSQPSLLIKFMIGNRRHSSRTTEPNPRMGNPSNKTRPHQLVWAKGHISHGGRS